VGLELKRNLLQASNFALYRNGTATEYQSSSNENGLARANPLILLAPRPGLEPGTCGLTEIQARQKPNKINDL